MANEALKGTQEPPAAVADKTSLDGGKGTEGNSEVQGHGRLRPYICWKCRTINWVDSDWDFFICRASGTYNWI